MRPTIAFAITLIFYSTGVMAQSVCGSLDLLSQNGAFVRNFLDTYGIAKKTDSRITCGVPGENFNICQSCSEAVTEDMMKVIRPMLASPAHRAWHKSWHVIRQELQQVSVKQPDRKFLSNAKCPSGYPPPAPPQQSEVKINTIREIPGEAKRRAAQVKEMIRKNRAGLNTKLNVTDLDLFARLHNDLDGEVAGEDFLFMHRQMIKMVNIELSYYGQPCIAPWSELPPADDRDWPIFTGERPPKGPPTSKPPRKPASAERAAEHLQMQKLTMKLGDETYLKSVTLTELGMCVGGELHSYMHGAYNDRSGVCESDNTKDFCDDLGPVDSSHVNRHFWKLHGLMDQFVGRWLKANGYDEIAASCLGKAKCYEWRGTWLGDMPGRSQKKE